MAQDVVTLSRILSIQPVIPVVKIEQVADAIPLARALVSGGLPAIEITLRTEAALDSIRAVSQEVPDALVGAGTILNPKQYADAVNAGAKFIVSPGMTKSLAEAAADSPAPLLPGAVTSSEIMAALELGYKILKFFPAEQVGGISYLKSLGAVFSDVKFCPTGGISPNNASDYLSLNNVICVGGSWVAPDHALKIGDWKAITDLSQQAASLR